MRMFAGPNGSGKSVLKSYLPAPLLGIYLNADEMEAKVKRCGFLDIMEFGVEASGDETLSFFKESGLLQKQGLTPLVEEMSLDGGRLHFPEGRMDSYLASVAADFLRNKLLQQQANFTFETVMSHPGKVDLLNRAQQAGYRTYLYYVATDDPEINISRVANRVKLNGHDVPPDRIRERYWRSLDLLVDAIRYSHRAYIFDNSTDNSDNTHTWLAEITDGKLMQFKTEQIPAWFKRAVLDKAVTSA